MSNESRPIVGSLLVVLSTVTIGGLSLLSMLLWEPNTPVTRCGGGTATAHE